MGDPEGDGLALAVDLGSSELKLGIISLTGEVVAVAQCSLETERLPGGGAVQDAASWWNQVLRLAKTVLVDGRAQRVAVVACTGQWASTVPVGETGEPVGPCLMWLDTRGAQHTCKILGGPLVGYSPLALLTWVRRTAGIPSVYGGDPVAHMLHLEHDDPTTAAAARWYLEPVDYLSMRFCGRPAATLASMSAAWLTDNRRLDRLEYDPLLLRKIGMRADKLPPLVNTGAITGSVRPEVAAELGLSSEVKVVTGTPDLHSAAIGTGAVGPGQAHTTISTTSWISLPMTRKKTDAIHSIATIPGLDATSYLLADNQEAAGLCLRWLREALSADGSLGFEDLTRLAAGAAPGSGGVLFTPWIAGERSPVDDRNARGGWHNVSVHARAPELVRSVLEGVAYNTRWLNRSVERFARHRIDRLRIFGGGAQSDLWCQIYADVLDRTIERVADPVYVNLRGAALFAAVALGVVRREQLAELVPVERVFKPDRRNRQTYDDLYAEFARLYKSQRRMFARLNSHGA